MPRATSIVARSYAVARWDDAVMDADTSTAPERARRIPLSDLLIVDTDVHVHESPGELAPYCDAPWDVALRNVADVPERYLDIPGFSPGGDGTLTARFPSGHEAMRMVHTPEQMVAELRAIDIDLALLFPDHLLKLPVLPQADYAAALARAYNAWLVDRWTAPHPMLLGALVACPQDPADAAREIERYADEDSIVAVYLPCAGLDPLWGHRRYDPIFDAAQNAGLPVLLHAVTVTSPVFPFNNHGFDTEFARHATSHTFAIIANVVSMVSTGVVVRFPELRIGVTESGISWVPFVCNRLDKEYLERRREVPFLTERPSHYVKRMYVATQPIEEPERLRDIVTLMELYDGERTTMYASDWPHHDFDHPMKLNQVPFTETQRRRVFGENALDLLGIDGEGRRR
jgi:predicted TIM-barrel fold metal-dependent hydrolase